tara:strand:- start:447 stop:1094 length:648 start_codon:yes stop_codon:yes gene_type:complete
MSVRRREDGEHTGEVVPDFPYLYGTDLHWLWGWGQRLEDFLEHAPFNPSQSDWIVIRADMKAQDAMMRFSIDYKSLVDEVKSRQEDVENRWKEVINNSTEATVGSYVESIDILSCRIMKACELIAEREDPSDANKELEDKTTSERASASKLFIGDVPSNPDIVDLVAKIDSNTDPKVSLIEIARKFTGESRGDEKRAKSLLSAIRRMKRDGRIKS